METCSKTGGGQLQVPPRDVLDSYGPGAQVGPENWSPRAPEIDNTKQIERNYDDYDVDMYHGENVDD